MDGDDSTKGFATNYASNAFFDGKTTPPFSAVWSSTGADLSAKTFPWTTLPKKTTGADVDGDGREELCVLYMSESYTPAGGSASRDLVLDIYDGRPDAGLLKETTLNTYGETAVAAFYKNAAVWNASLGIVAGRFTGTSEYQLAVSAMGAVYVAGSTSSGYALGKPLQLTAAVTDGLQVLKLAAGDLDGDGKDEIVAMNGILQSSLKGAAGTAYYSVLNGSLETLAGPTTVSNGGTATLSSGSVSVGDLDGDKLGELVFCGNQGSSGIYTIVLDDAKQGYANLAWAQNGATSGWYSIGCAALDYDGDGIDEILGSTRLFDDFTNASGSSLKVLTNDVVAGTGWVGGMYWDDCIATGQLNGSAAGKTADACEDIALLSSDVSNMIILSWSAPGSAMTATNVDTNANYGYYPCLSAANIDDDSTYIAFKGRELLYTDPHVIAFLSCYPYWTGIDMTGGGNAGSSYSTGVTASSGSDRTVGMSAGISFGYTGGIPTYAEYSFTASITTSFDYNWGSSYEVSVSKEFTTTNEDKVIFSSIPYDVYYYEVASSPSAQAGDKIVVSVPRAPIISSAEVGFYNDNNGACQDITTSNLITHTIGNPKSYPGPDFVLDRLGDNSMFLYNDDVKIHAGGPACAQVGQGTGVQKISLSYSTSSSATKVADIGIEVTAGMKAGGYTMDASVGFHYGESYTVSSGTDTTFSGAIGNLSAADAAAGKGFPFSLFVYGKTLENTKDRVLVLEYCYEGK